MQAISRASQIERARCGIEHGEDIGNADSEGGINEASLALFEHLLESLVAEARYHSRNCTVTRVTCQHGNRKSRSMGETGSEMKAGIQERLLREVAELGEEEAQRRRAERLSRDQILGSFLRTKMANGTPTIG